MIKNAGTWGNLSAKAEKFLRTHKNSSMFDPKLGKGFTVNLFKKWETNPSSNVYTLLGKKPFSVG